MLYASIHESAVAALLAMTLLAGSAAQGESDKSAEAARDSTWVDIASWNMTDIYDGWSADDLLDEEVYGIGGDEIGEVEDFIVDSDGKIRKVVVEGGGFLDIGDSHIAVPWEKVDRIGVSSIVVPVTDGNLDDYLLFEEGVDDKPAQGGNWRTRNLLGDYLTVNERRYGHVLDIIFDEDDVIEAVIAQPAYGYGYPRGRYAFPYYANSYDPYGPTYDTPYTRVQIEKLAPVDYSKFE